MLGLSLRMKKKKRVPPTPPRIQSPASRQIEMRFCLPVDGRRANPSWRVGRQAGRLAGRQVGRFVRTYVCRRGRPDGIWDSTPRNARSCM